MNLKPFDYFGDEETSAVLRVMSSKVLSGFYGNWGDKFQGGPEVQAFERECEEYFGCKNAVTFNSLASGLSSAIGAIGIEPGDEVIVPTWTMSATAAAVLHWGGIPVFADIDRNTYCIDADSVISNISNKTRAIIAVDIFGQSANLEKLLLIAKDFKLKLISDSAQAVGAKRNGSYAGTMADIGGISLNYHKHIHSGEGAVMFTNDDDLALRMKLIRNHAEAVVAEVPFKIDLINMVGHNYRMTELQAAIGREQLKKLSRIVLRREGEVSALYEQLFDVPGITLPWIDTGNTHVFYTFAMQFSQEYYGVCKETFVNLLLQNGVPGISSRYLNLHLLPLFQKKIAYGKSGHPWTYHSSRQDISYKKGICPVAENLQDDVFFSFYINDYLLDLDDIKLIGKVFRETSDSLSKS